MICQETPLMYLPSTGFQYFLTGKLCPILFLWVCSLNIQSPPVFKGQKLLIKIPLLVGRRDTLLQYHNAGGKGTWTSTSRRPAWSSSWVPVQQERQQLHRDRRMQSQIALLLTHMGTQQCEASAHFPHFRFQMRKRSSNRTVLCSSYFNCL